MKYTLYIIFSLIMLLQNTYAAYESVYKKVFYEELKHEEKCHPYVIKWIKYYDLAYKLAPMNTLYEGTPEDKENDTPAPRVINNQDKDNTRDGLQFLTTLTDDDICMFIEENSVNGLKDKWRSTADETRFKEIIKRLAARENRFYTLEKELTIIGKTIAEGGNNNVSHIEPPIENMPEWDEIEPLNTMDRLFFGDFGQAIKGDCTQADVPTTLYEPPLCKPKANDNIEGFYGYAMDDRKIGCECYKDSAEIPFFSHIIHNIDDEDDDDEEENNLGSGKYDIRRHYWLQQYTCFENAANDVCKITGTFPMKQCSPFFQCGLTSRGNRCIGCSMNYLTATDPAPSEGCIESSCTPPDGPLKKLASKPHMAMCIPKSLPPNPLLNGVSDMSCEGEIQEMQAKHKRHAIPLKDKSFVEWLINDFVEVINNIYTTKLALEFNDLQTKALKEIGCDNAVYRHNTDRFGNILEFIEACSTNKTLRDEHIKTAIERTAMGKAEQDRAVRADNRYQLLAGSTRALYDYTWHLRVIWECHKKNKCHFK